jgi:endonuclease YncB( thermonuclease family)
MLDIFQPSPALTSTWFIKKRVGCAVWPAGAIMKVIGTKSRRAVIVDGDTFAIGAEKIRIKNIDAPPSLSAPVVRPS